MLFWKAKAYIRRLLAEIVTTNVDFEILQYSLLRSITCFAAAHLSPLLTPCRLSLRSIRCRELVRYSARRALLPSICCGPEPRAGLYFCSGPVLAWPVYYGRNVAEEGSAQVLKTLGAENDDGLATKSTASSQPTGRTSSNIAWSLGMEGRPTQQLWSMALSTILWWRAGPPWPVVRWG